MEIANPIYAAAFKYLMQDDRAARLLVGRISWGRQADSERRRAERAEQALSRPIRHLRGLGQEPDAIAAAFHRCERSAARARRLG